MATLGFVRAAALASIVVLSGCSAALGDPNREAASHLTSCLGSGAGGVSEEEEVGARGGVCVDRCIKRAGCEELVDAYSGSPTAASEPFLGCASACSAGR